MSQNPALLRYKQSGLTGRTVVLIRSRLRLPLCLQALGMAQCDMQDLRTPASGAHLLVQTRLNRMRDVIGVQSSRRCPHDVMEKGSASAMHSCRQLPSHSSKTCNLVQ